MSENGCCRRSYLTEFLGRRVYHTHTVSETIIYCGPREMRHLRSLISGDRLLDFNRSECVICRRKVETSMENNQQEDQQGAGNLKALD